jgi:hypothetical protein
MGVRAQLRLTQQTEPDVRASSAHLTWSTKGPSYASRETETDRTGNGTGNIQQLQAQAGPDCASSDRYDRA